MNISASASASAAAAAAITAGEFGFAKLQGRNFDYFMRTYSILLGRNSKHSTVDLDLATVGDGRSKSISRYHARISYDFPHRRFSLEVFGRNGCYVEGVLYLPGCLPVELDSQDLIEIGEVEFYFLLPTIGIHNQFQAPIPVAVPLVGVAAVADGAESDGGADAADDYDVQIVENDDVQLGDESLMAGTVAEPKSDGSDNADAKDNDGIEIGDGAEKKVDE